MRRPWRRPRGKELWVASRYCRWPQVNSQHEDGGGGEGVQSDTNMELNSVNHRASLKEDPEL